MEGKTILVIVVTAIITTTLVLFMVSRGENKNGGDYKQPLPEIQSGSLPTLPEGEFVKEGEAIQERAVITREMVDALYLGVSVEEVETRWGMMSDEMESEYDPGIQGYTAPFSIVWHTWNNPDGTKVRLGFIGKKLDRKQFHEKDGTFTTSEIDLKALSEDSSN